MGDVTNYLRIKTGLTACFDNMASNNASANLKADPLIIQRFIDDNVGLIVGYMTTSTYWGGTVVHVLLESGVKVSMANINGLPEKLK